MFDDITLSPEAIEKFKSGARQYPKLEFSNVEDSRTKTRINMVLTSEHITLQGLSIELLSVTGSEFELGTMCAGEAKIELRKEATVTVDNTTVTLDKFYFDESTVKVSVGVEVNGTVEYCKFGVYQIDESKRTKNTISLTALDNMMKFNKKCSPTGSSQGDPTYIIRKGDTIITAIEEICSNCGVDYISEELEGLRFGMYEIENIPEGLAQMTCRQILMQLVSITGCCGRMDGDGKFRVSPYEFYDVTISKAERYESEFDEKYVELTGVNTVNFEGYSTLGGNEGYVLELMQNDFVVSAFSQYLTQMLWDYMREKHETKYLPYLVTTVSMPHIRPLQKIKVIDNEDNECDTIVTNYLFRLNNSTKIQAKGIGRVRKNYGKPNEFTRNQSRIIEKVMEVAESNTNQSDRLRQEFDELISGAMGLYKRELDGKPYFHDKPTLETSNKIFTWTSEGIAWTDTGWNGGNVVWKNGVSAAGDAFFRHLLAGGIVVGDGVSDYDVTITPQNFAIKYQNQTVTSIDRGLMSIPRLQIRSYLNIGPFILGPNEANELEVIYTG